MYRRVAQRLTLRTAIAVLICFALLPMPAMSLVMAGAAQGQGERRKGNPKPGKPEGILPDLDEVQKESGLEREPAPPIPSTLRSPKAPLRSWDGKRVGDPGTQGAERGDAGSMLAFNTARITRTQNTKTRRSHARSRVHAPPPVLDDQFVLNFFNWTVSRAPYANESTFWNDQCRVAYAQGQTSVMLVGVALGKTLFESAEYAARNRNDHWYVYDLYKTFLLRDPDASGWAYWESVVPVNGRENVRRAFEVCPEFAGIIASIVPNGSATANAASLISARVDPRNQPANGMLTRDANWSVPLLSLPGRAGLDLGLALSYSSMVWTRSGPYIHFDEDNGFPSPGFRLGFPIVQRKVFDAQTAKNAFLLVTPTGKRVELRQVGSSNIYEAADSSYLQLTDNSTYLTVRSTDGTQLSFTEINNEFSCTQVKDRNGNYLTINHNYLGRIATITDTLGRVITFNYDGNANLISITQSWHGQSSHQWVSFGWGTRTMQSSFSDSTLRGVIGTANGAVLPVITQVNLNDTSYFTFDYTNSLQLSAIRNYFDMERNATTFTYETPVGDAPRLLDSRVSALNWTGINGVPSQVITTYSVTADGACVMTTPDGAVYKEYYGSGWQRGLLTASEVRIANQVQKWTTTTWTQDNTSVAYEVNPRVTETNVYDASGNRRRTAISYYPTSWFSLPSDVYEYAADGTTVLRRMHTDYNLSSTYTDRRIIGLPISKYIFDGNNTLHQLDVFDYDYGGGFLIDTPQTPTQHDASYGVGFVGGRGNLSIIRHTDVINPSNPAHDTLFVYNKTGSITSVIDPAGHTQSFSYVDSFSDAVNRNTFAYPTTTTDADGFNSYVQYNFDFGATTRTQSPTPAGQAQGAIQTMMYNNLGQLERITTTNTGAYTRYIHGSYYVQSFASINNVADEAYSCQVFDGLGRVIGSSANHPGSTGGYRAQNIYYDLMGRAVKTSNPTEITGTWVPVGDDVSGWLYTQQTYDWQGRPLVTTNTDGTTKEASYGGCGCAGGAVVTLTDEGTIDAGVAKRRQQKIYSDVLGRRVKTEILNWQNGTVYSAVVNTYNARDQLTQIRQYAGVEGSGTYQDTTMAYDGYGRLKTKHVPEPSAGTTTTYNYNNDDTLSSVIDARGAATIYSYNNRHLVNGISYTAPPGSGIAVPSAVTYAYDAAGNRTSMFDGLGSVTYSYDSLSRMTSETRNISQPTTPLTYSINYQYNLAGQLTSITDPNNKIINYMRDSVGRLSAITGPSFAGVTSYLSALQYRAWGAVRHANYGDGKTSDATYNNRMKAASFVIPNVMSKTYDYYADGTLKFSSDLLDHRFDRLYHWDHAGRIKEAYSGADARNEGPTTNRPYRQLYSYDQMGHLTQRTNSSWNIGPTTTFDSYTNNRHDAVGQLWQYDADGNLLMMPGAAYAYDADGRIDAAWSDSSATFGLDGDGRKVKSVEVVWDPVQEIDVTTYGFSIFSSVLGRVLTEKVTNDDPNSPYAYYTSTTFVYGDSGVIAWQESNSSLQEWVWWEHRDPSNASYTTGNPARQQELDPTGANQGISDASYQSIPEEGILAPYPATNNPSQPNMTYSIDGIRVSLDDFIQNLQIIFHGDIGLNEAVARQSANEANYQRRYVLLAKRLFEWGYAEIGYWETSALSAAPSLASLGFETQNPEDDVSMKRFSAWDLAQIRKDVMTIAARGRCQEFLTKLLTTAGDRSGDKPKYTNIVDLFDAVHDQKSFMRQATWSGRGFSSVIGAVGAPGGARVLLSNSSNDFKGKLRIQYFAYDALSELTHVAGNKPGTYATGAFSDYELAKTALDVANEMRGHRENLTLPTVDPEHDQYGQWSDAYHHILSLYCKRQERF